MLKVYAIETTGGDKHEIARLLLRWKYEEIWDRELPEIGVGERGKPYFLDGSGHFSISYSENICCVALCDGPVGLDIERHRNVSANAISRILSREEWLLYSSSQDPTEAFLKFWTLKEAYGKFTGDGIIKSRLQSISFDISRERPVLLHEPKLQFWSKKVEHQGVEIIVSLCADEIHRPEFYGVEL